MRKAYFQVVAQIVETELVVGAVSYVAGIGGALLVVGHVVNVYAHGKSQKAVNLTHPFSVAPGEVIVYRNHMHTLSGKRVEICRQR